MPSPQSNLTIGAFAREAGVNVETIRFYQRKGLLAEPEKPQGGIRRYGGADVARVRFVKTAQGLGFTLDEVAQLLRLDDGTHCDDAKRLAQEKLHSVQGKLADLHRIEGVLRTLVSRCATTRGKVSCPLIAALQEQA
jgi:MerR family mercuric resistance operon transcriptional regulator